MSLRNSMCALFVVLLAVDVVADEPVKIQYQFKAGQIMTYEGGTKVTFVSSPVGEEKNEDLAQKIEMEASWVREWKVLDVDAAGNASVQMSLLRVKLDFDSRDGRKSFDSEKDEETPFKAYVGKPMLQAKLTSSGQLYDIKELIENVGGQFLANVPSLICPVPEVAVQTGTRWQKDIPVQLPPGSQKVTVRHTYKLRKSESGAATIAVETTPIEKVDGSVQVQLAQYLPKGEIQFDLKSGLMRSQNLTLDHTIQQSEETVTRVTGHYRERLMSGVAKGSSGSTRQ